MSSSRPSPQLKGPLDWMWYLFCGLCMGAADIVPGISGGTVALLLGYYEELIKNIERVNIPAISLLFRFQFKAFSKRIAWKFLLLLLLGLLAALAALSQVITFLLNDEVYRAYLYSGFLGLILASALFCAREVKVWNVRNYGAFFAGAAAALLLTTMPFSKTPSSHAGTTYCVALPSRVAPVKKAANYDCERRMLLGVEPVALRAMLEKGYIDRDTLIVDQLTGKEGVAGDVAAKSAYPFFMPWMIFCGAIGISAMLLPGISGSYLLSILGVYPLVIGAVADLTGAAKSLRFDADAFILLANFLVGILIGAALFSRIISWLFARCRDAVVALLIGFMVGALRAVWPFWSYAYELLPLKLDSGVQLIPEAPYFPDPYAAFFWISLGVAASAFLLVVCLEFLTRSSHLNTLQSSQLPL